MEMESMISQLEDTTSEMEDTTSQMEDMTSQMGDAISQIEGTTLQMEDMISQMGGTTSQMESTSSQRRHVCPYENCESSFTRPYRLAQHILVHQNKRVFKCAVEDCGKSYTSNSHLFRHITSVHKKTDNNEYINSCPQCLKTYANRQNLKRHIKIYHYLRTPFACDVCNTEFKKKNQLSAHMYRHTGIKAFSCELCPKAFVTLYDKKRHMRFHKTYRCTDCIEVFNHWSDYQMHKKSEHKQNEYVCDHCQRSFKNRARIVHHIKNINTVVSKAFFCPYEACMNEARSYTMRKNLKQHIRRKHFNITHNCNICDAKLSTKTKLNLHIMKRHGSTETHGEVKQRVTKRKDRSDKGSFKRSTAMRLAAISDKLLDNGTTLVKLSSPTPDME